MRAKASLRKPQNSSTKRVTSNVLFERLVFAGLFLASLLVIRLLASFIPLWTFATVEWRHTLTLSSIFLDALIAISLMGVVVWNATARAGVVAIVVWAAFLNLRYFQTWEALGIQFSYNPGHTLKAALEKSEESKHSWVTSLLGFYSFLGATFPSSKLIVPHAQVSAMVPWVAAGTGGIKLVVDGQYDPQLSVDQVQMLRSKSVSERIFPGDAYLKPFHFFYSESNSENATFRLHFYEGESFVFPLGLL